MNIFFSPLEQFEIVPLIPIRFGTFDISFSNSSFFIILCIFIFLFFSYCLSAEKNGFIIPGRYQLVIENFFTFTIDMVIENLGFKGQNFFPFICAMFAFLLCCNLLGLVPYSYTVTSHFIVTFSLSLIVWVGKLFVGFKMHGIKLFSILLPGGIPLPIIPFFVIVELISFFIPLVALGVRLFANIIAGHILLKVIVGFCWSMLLAGGGLFIAHFIPIGVLFLLLFLETAVAFIQAYVFSILSCLILGDIIRGGH